MNAALEELCATGAALRDAVQRVIIGQEQVVEEALIALLCGGHVLIEGVPGLGKTLLVESLAKAINGQFHRVQFTPDLLPADITGSMIYDPVARSSPTCCLPTKSTVPRQKRRRRCSKSCKSGK